MSKKAVLSTINEMNKIIKSMPNLNETLSFGGEPLRKEEEEYDFNVEDDDMPDEAPMDSEDSSNNSTNIKHNSLVDKIRKMALDGMSELAEHTDDPNYEILKKIWQFCDKKVEDNKKSVEKSLPM